MTPPDATGVLFGPWPSHGDKDHLWRDTAARCGTRAIARPNHPMRPAWTKPASCDSAVVHRKVTQRTCTGTQTITLDHHHKRNAKGQPHATVSTNLHTPLDAKRLGYASFKHCYRYLPKPLKLNICTVKPYIYQIKRILNGR